MAISWLRFGLSGGVQRFARPHTPRPSLRLREVSATGSERARHGTTVEIRLNAPINWGAVDAVVHAIMQTAATPEPPEDR